MEKVDTPHLWPTACMLCRGQKGPMVDTGVEFPVAGFSPDSASRVYVCRRCAKEIALIFGFAKGPELAKLIDAADVVEAKEREAKEYQEIGEDLVEQLKVKDAMIKSLEKNLDTSLSRIQALEGVVEAVKRNASEITSAA